MIVIVGAGPAGLAAAKAIARHGVSCTVIDAASKPGGQYWRFRDLVQGYKSQRAYGYFDELRSSPKITYINAAQVWSATRTNNLITLNYLQAGIEKSLKCQTLILTTGAYDRSIPFPGWEKPGSMTPGAAQALLKGHGVVVGKKIAISGTGPFLLPVAVGLAEAGAEVVGVFEAHSPLRWLRSPIALAFNPEKFFELFYYAKKIKKHSIPMKFGKVVTQFSGSTAFVSRVNSELSIKRNSDEIQCDVVASGWGFVPDLSLGGILGCKEIVSVDGTVIFSVDRNQQSTVGNIFIAGEATGIGGSDLALIEGEIAGLASINKRIPFTLRFHRARKQLFARALIRSYPVGNGWQKWLAAKTLICRCEEVSCSQVLSSVVELKAEDSRTSKLFTRAGMGLCQGRVCSRNVSEIIAGAKGVPVADTERISYSNRPLAAPISLGSLADGIGEK